MKKEEIYVKLTDKNREKVFEILDMFGEELNLTDNICRHTMRYESGNSINDYPTMIFYDGYWYLWRSIYGLKKTKVKPRELKQILAKEHLKKGDVVVVENSMGKWILELTGNNVHKFEFSKSYDKKCINAPHVRTIEYGIFIRFATEEECKLLRPVVFECASCEQELDISQRSDDKPNLCNNCFKHAIISFEDRVWYKKKDTGFVANYVTDGVGYGINNQGLWENGIRMSDPTIWSKATPEEVEQALLREAESRGLVEGCLTTSLDDDKKFIISGSRHPLLSVDLGGGNTLWVISDDDVGYCIFDNGKWAEPIDKFSELKQAHKNGAIIQYKRGGEWDDCLDNKPNWIEENEYRIKPGEPKTTEGKKLAKYGDVCKFYNINPGVFVVGRLAHFGKAHDKKVYYCVGLDAPFYNAEPITKEEAIKLLF